MTQSDRAGASGLAVAELAVVVEDRDATAPALLAQALDRAGFWDHIAAERQRAADAEPFRVVIHPDLDAFAVGSPAIPAPATVEAFVDLLHERGYTDVAVCATSDSAWFWAENRSVAALAELLGYAYVTPGGHPYDVVDLSEDLVPAAFPEAGVLHGTLLGRAWQEAHFRICLARNKTDERDGYALCLSGLLGVLPLADKEDHYRRRMPAGAVVTDLLRAAPVHFAVVDATVSAHGSGGARAPLALSTGVVIASRNVLLADFVGALKMGLDPYVSPLASAVFRAIGLPARYTVDGNLAVHAGWRNVDPLLRDAVRRRDALPGAARLFAPWLQTLDAELFPLKHTVDAKLNPRVSRWFENPDRDPAALHALIAVGQAAGLIGDAREAWRVLYDKDTIQRLQVPLALDLDRLTADDYEAIRAELEGVEAMLAGAPAATESLRWRKVGGATVFGFERELAIPFDTFVARVDVARTIQFMNDYIGGVVVPTARDAAGRVIRQAERNLYLPQPNYLALYGGKMIDVTKLEVCDYAGDLHRMVWKTVHSENASAEHDDGIVTFARSERGTRVRIVGRQRFVLPEFWQRVDLDRWPDLKASLVTHAYETFFARTCANFEALVEGRDIRIGQAGHVTNDPFDAAPPPVERLERLAIGLVEKLQATRALSAAPAARVAGRAAVRIDDDGFRHFAGTAAATSPPVDQASGGVAEFVAGLARAFTRDAEAAFGSYTAPSR
jgi:uncharacterized protein (DUF362 family)